MEIEILADKARESLSNFCMIECKAYCCRKGFLILKENELDITVNDKKTILIKENSLIKKEDGTYSLNFSNSLGGCPSLHKAKCAIHKNVNRSAICKKYPIFMNHKNKTINLSKKCLGVRENKLYPFECKAIKLGYKLM